MNDGIDNLDKQDLYLQVKDFIRDYINRGDFNHSNREFAKMVKVSTLTVQRAVSALAEEGVLYARRGKGTFISDSAMNGHVSRKKTGLYACLVPTIESNTVAATISALDDLNYKDSGHHMLMCNSLGDFDREVSMLDSLLDRTIDALVYQPNVLLYEHGVFVRAVHVRLQKFLAAGVPVVLLDDFIERDTYDTIVPDENEMCRLALQHLQGLGHKRIAFMAYEKSFERKIQAFEVAAKDAGLGHQEVRILFLKGHDIDTATAEALDKLLEDGWPFTGIVAATDRYALACYRHLKTLNIKCPKDVSIVGADNLEFIENIEVGLTTVWSEPMEVAKQVIELIEARTNQGYLRKISAIQIETPVKLVTRQSTSKSLSA